MPMCDSAASQYNTYMLLDSCSIEQRTCRMVVWVVVKVLLLLIVMMMVVVILLLLLLLLRVMNQTIVVC